MGATGTPGQLYAIMVMERISSGFSLVGLIFILVTFFTWPQFRRPINRLIVYASVGNLIANVATWISTSGSMAGANSHLCQAQAFITQM